MPAPIYPRKLRAGDTVRVVAPSRSRALVMEHDNTRWINERFAEMELHLSFGEHVDEDDEFRSGSRTALFDEEPMVLEPSPHWTDDAWFADQDDRTLIANDGWLALRVGEATGRIVGGNLCTLNLLQGTPYMPSLDGALLFLEDDDLTSPVELARNLTSLLQVEGAEGIAGLAIGRFQRTSGISREILEAIVARQPALAGKPVLAGLDFGHTSPMITFPVGGEASMRVGSGPGGSSLVLTRH